jgi:hypothetical protein
MMHYATHARCFNHSLDWKIAEQSEWGAPRLLRGTFLAFRDDSAGIVSNGYWITGSECSRTADKGWSSNSRPGRVRGSDKVQISPPERCVRVGDGVKPPAEKLVSKKDIWGGGGRQHMVADLEK